jgi:hypothetical protein
MANFNQQRERKDSVSPETEVRCKKPDNPYTPLERNDNREKKIETNYKGASGGQFVRKKVKARKLLQPPSENLAA